MKCMAKSCLHDNGKSLLTGAGIAIHCNHLCELPGLRFWNGVRKTKQTMRGGWDELVPVSRKLFPSPALLRVIFTFARS